MNLKVSPGLLRKLLLDLATRDSILETRLDGELYLRFDEIELDTLRGTIRFFLNKEEILAGSADIRFFEGMILNITGLMGLLRAEMES